MEMLRKPLLKLNPDKESTASGGGLPVTAASNGMKPRANDTATLAAAGLHGSEGASRTADTVTATAAGANGVGDQSNELDDSGATSSDKKPEEPGPSDHSEAGDSTHQSAPYIVVDIDMEPRISAASITSKIEILRDKSSNFAEAVAASSMASEAASFLNAITNFDGKLRKKVTDTQLSKTGRMLHNAACRAPVSEADLAAVAVEIAGESLDILLSSSVDPVKDCGFCTFEGWRSWFERLMPSRSGLEPTLPVHHQRLQEKFYDKVSDKRQTLFGIALGVPVALLTSVASLKVFPSSITPWVVGTSALLWVAISGGLVMDLYGKTKLESEVSNCLSRMGMMGVTVLFCLFIFGVFLPSSTVIMWLLVAIAVGFHLFLCVRSCVQGDDQTYVVCEETARKYTGCTCKCSCNLDV